MNRVVTILQNLSLSEEKIIYCGLTYPYHILISKHTFGDFHIGHETGFRIDESYLFVGIDTLNSIKNTHKSIRRAIGRDDLVAEIFLSTREIIVEFHVVVQGTSKLTAPLSGHIIPREISCIYFLESLVDESFPDFFQFSEICHIPDREYFTEIFTSQFFQNLISQLSNNSTSSNLIDEFLFELLVLEKFSQEIFSIYGLFGKFREKFLSDILMHGIYDNRLYDFLLNFQRILMYAIPDIYHELLIHPILPRELLLGLENLLPSPRLER